MNARPRPLLIAVCCLLTSGCFEITQEIWIHEDGSGRVSLDMGISEFLLAAATREGEDPLGELRVYVRDSMSDRAREKMALREYSEGGLHHVVIESRVDDITEISQRSVTLDEGSVPALADLVGSFGSFHVGDVLLERLDNGHLRYEHTVVLPAEAMAALATGEVARKAEVGRAFLASLLSNNYWTVRVHGPEIISTNGELNEERSTAEWRIPIADVIAPDSSSWEFRAEVRLSRSWPIELRVGIGVLVLILAGVALFLQRRLA